MTTSSVTATPAQLEEARKLLVLFSSQPLSYRRGAADDRANARGVLVGAIAANGAGEWDMGDAIHEARYYLGLTCLECSAVLEDSEQMRHGYCSRECYVAGGL